MRHILSSNLRSWNFPASIINMDNVLTIMDKTIAQALATEAMRQAILTQNEFVGSMSRKGDCWDNAVAEIFFHTLKVELVHRNKFRTRDEAKRKIFEYVEMYYNRKRAHSMLGYLSPFEYERRSALVHG